MHSDFKPIQISTPIASLRAESDTAMISEGLIAIALPLGMFLAVLVRKNRKRHLLKRQIEMLERLWQSSSDKVQ
ncbi:MAG: hypothetical protein C4288_05685 [Leptolyngbya sp. ERB_1_1]